MNMNEPTTQRSRRHHYLWYATMKISPPPTLRSPVKARSGSSHHCCPTNTSKLLRIFLSIGAVGLLLINQNFQGYDNLDNTSTLDGSAAVTASSSKGDGDDTKDRQLRKPKQAVREEPELDFAVVGFEKTGTSLDVHFMCDIQQNAISVHFTANYEHNANLFVIHPLCRHNIFTRSLREPSRNYHAGETLPRR